MSAPLGAVIVGGGITGLATAHGLAAAGRRFLLVEAAKRLGGTIGTEHVDGFLIDQGPDSFLATRPEGRALCESLGLGDALITPEPSARRVYVRSRGRLRAMPEGMVLGVPTSIASFLGSDFLPLGAKLRMGLDLLLPRGRAEEESIAGFVGRRFGREAVAVIAEPLLAGIHSGRAEDLSMHANFPQIVALERKYRSLIRGFRALARAGAGESPFLSLREGMGQLVDGVSRTLPEGSVLLGRRAVRLGRTAAGWALDLHDGTRIEARSAVLAIRSHEAAVLVEGFAPDLAAVLSEIAYASSAVLFYAYERDQVASPLDAFGFVTRPGEGRVMAATFVSSKFAGRAPPGKVLLRAFAGGARDEDALRLSDAELSELVRRELAELLGIRGAPLFTRVFRYDRATPQMRVGHAGRVARLRAREAEHPGLYIAGAGYEGVGIPECVRQGWQVAQRIAGEKA
jgi:oxygen-dependent protoporphyrinogen oxidase